MARHYRRTSRAPVTGHYHRRAMDPPAISVVVPARDAAGTLPRTLECLAAQSHSVSVEVILADDGSRDETVQLAREAPLDVRVVRQERKGPAEARNMGVAAARAPALAFLDADCFPQPGWLAAGLRALGEADLVQGRVLPDPATPVGPFDRTLVVGAEVGLWETANLFVTRDCFDRVGGFEDWLEVELGKTMAEDVWFGWRARRAGARTSFCADALAFHAVFPRGPAGYLSERRRVRYFPAIARKTPELRKTMFFHTLFLSGRTAAFDAALAGAGLAALTRSRLPLLAALPYARVAWLQRLRHYRRRAALVAAVDGVADGLTAFELLRGSIRARTPVL
jgi:glycosyltransferase involved in cell wall biosynthesis